MKYDPHLPRFMSYLSLFTFFMLILITANNFLQMFVGWEGVGLCSYLLINFWFTRIQANKSAIKAMLVNRVGDFSLLLAIFSIYFIFNTLEYDVVFTLVPLVLDYFIVVGFLKINLLDIICLLLFIGAMGKSAQLSLHTWLPDAMEGPTPVSALIHAATMVTAGVFLLARCSFIFEFSQITLNIVAFIGSITALFAATTGLFQNDLKKVIAYSTCSQLGYMIFSCGLSSYEVGIFHLSNHAFFKALLFLGAGSVIHAVNDEQDMRKLGGLKRLLPFSYSIMLIGSLALMGIPFLTGFYSKDVILEIAYAKFTILSHFSYILGTTAALCTAFYSIRLLFLVFLSEPNGNRIILINSHESPWKITFTLFILSFLSLSIGYMTKEFFIGFGTNFWNESIFIVNYNYNIIDIEFVSLFYKLLPLFFTIIGACLSYFTYCFNLEKYLFFKKTKFFKKIYAFLNKKWYFDRIYNENLSQNFLNFSYLFTYKNIDRGILETVGPHGIVNTSQKVIKDMIPIQSGYITHYLFMFLVSFFIIFYIYFFFFSICSLLLILFFIIYFLLD